MNKTEMRQRLAYDELMSAFKNHHDTVFFKLLTKYADLYPDMITLSDVGCLNHATVYEPRKFVFSGI